MSIAVQHVTKRFAAFTALDDVSLEVPSGELVALLGPSGSGKTTLLRIIAGLETPDRGSVRLHGRPAAGDLRRRGVGFVFQHYALFRHMSVFENVAFGLRVRPRRQRPTEAEIRARVNALLELVQLQGLAQHRPAELSGGQRQRVALARALAVEPRVLLLDEPFGALDAKVRQELRRWLRRLHDELHVISVFVTHDQEEALEVADRVVVMNRGRIEQVGTPDEAYDWPATPFVLNFLGRVNIFRGRLAADGGAAGAVGYARPHDLRLAVAPEPGSVEAVIRRVRLLGPLARVELQRRDTGEALEAEMAREAYQALERAPGDLVHVLPRNLLVFGEGVRQRAGDGVAGAGGTDARGLRA